jgi:hypothetical protein
MTERSALPPSWDLPREFRNRLGKQAGRQRAMLCNGHLLLVLHRVPGPEEVDREARFFWRKPDGTWSSNELGSGTQALDDHLDEYADAYARCDREEEAAATNQDRFAVLDALAPIHRATRHMHQTLQEARKMVPDDRDLLIFRDRAYEIERSVELLYNEARNSLDFAVAQRAEAHAQSSYRMAVSAHRLNLLAAFFFPIATLTALFGVNMRHGLETAHPPIPFLAVLGLGLVLGGLLTSFVTITPEKRAVGKARRDGPRPADPRMPDGSERASLASDHRFGRR